MMMLANKKFILKIKSFFTYYETSFILTILCLISKLRYYILLLFERLIFASYSRFVKQNHYLNYKYLYLILKSSSTADMYGL